MLVTPVASPGVRSRTGVRASRRAVVTVGAHDGWWVLTDGRELAEKLRLHRWLRVEVLPISLSIPWGLTIGLPLYIPWPMRVRTEILAPIELERSGEEASDDDDYVEACHRHVLATMQRTMDRLAEELRGEERSAAALAQRA